MAVPEEPAVLILPPDEQARYDRKMRSCQAGWQGTGDPWALAEAVTLTTLYHQPIPQWIDDGVWALCCRRRTKDHAKRAYERNVRWLRYCAVCDARARGLSWAKAYAHASEVFANNSDVAAEPDQMRKAYSKVKNDLKKGDGGKYFFLKPRGLAPEPPRTRPYGPTHP
jgi:hypothetical protein